MRSPRPNVPRAAMPAGPSRPYTKRTPLPRLRIAARNFSALGLVALGVTGGLLASSALATPTPAPPSMNLKVLLVGGVGGAAADPTTAAWAAALTSEGVPFTEVDATGTAGSEAVALPALTTGTTGQLQRRGVRRLAGEPRRLRADGPLRL